MAATQLAGTDKVTKYISRVFIYLIFILFTVITTYPLIWLGYSSFKSNTEITTNQLTLPNELLQQDKAWIVEVDLDVITEQNQKAKLENVLGAMGYNPLRAFNKLYDARNDEKRFVEVNEPRLGAVPGGVLGAYKVDRYSLVVQNPTEELQAKLVSNIEGVSLEEDGVLGVDPMYINDIKKALADYEGVSLSKKTEILIDQDVIAEIKAAVENVDGVTVKQKNRFVENYSTAWELGKFGTYFFNSVLYTVVATGATLLFATMAAFAFAKLRIGTGKLTWFLYNLLLIGLLISIHAILVPLFIMWSKIGLLNTQVGLIIPYIAVGLPMAVYLSTEFIKGIPDAIIESGTIDGASYFTIFGRLILPMTGPVLVTVGILTTMANWNEFILASILTDRPEVQTLPIGIFSFSGPLATQYGLQFAGLVIGLLPIVIVYAIFNRQITKGVVAGSVKG